MESKLAIFLLILTSCTVLSENVKKEDYGDDISAYAQMASSFLNDESGENIGGLLNNLVQSEGGKQLGDMLLNMGNNKNANQILQGLSSLISQPQGDNSVGGALDASVLTTVLSMLQSADSGGKKESAPDASGLLSTFGSLLGKESGLEGVMGLLPLIMNTVNSFTGDEAQKRVESHSSHAWFIPPVLEKIHVLIDHFMNSDIGKSALKNFGTEKFIKVFTDGSGKFDIAKFLQLLENHSFRKHWIEMITRRIAVVISYFADPVLQKKFVASMQYFFNSFIKTQGFPKSAMFDPAKPTETISSFINFVSKKYLGYKINAKQYVKPAVEYVQELVKLAQNQGFFTGRAIDSSELSHKLADTINLEIIEPVARVYRAYRFAKKHPRCDKYVLCLVNQRKPEEAVSLPGLKMILSKSTSIFASWFLSGHTGTPFWSLYGTITGESENDCKFLFEDNCNEFHVEEIKVTTEYVHNEL